MVQNKITVARGDGIGPEIMDAVLKILAAAKCDLQIDEVEIGKVAYDKGFNTGIPPVAWDVIRRNKVLLKAPLTTPQGKGFSSVNVALRKNFGLYANVRPVKSLYPYINSLQPEMDIVIIRENEEDLYSGIEYRTSPNTSVSLKLISQQGSEKIIRYAFEYAKKNKRKKVSCVTKDNIMKISDGMFHNIFNEVAKEYPEIINDHYIVDIGSARVASSPQQFDVLVTLNLYGDIISDIAAEVSGSVGVAGSVNIGENAAMFEAVHGSAPDIAGQNIANPSGLLQAAILMLEYLEQGEKAKLVKAAWYKTIESGIHTADIYNASSSKQKVGTDEFANAIIENFSEVVSDELITSNVTKVGQIKTDISQQKAEIAGVDVYLQHVLDDVNKLAKDVSAICDNLNLQLSNISFKGMQIWPNKEIDYVYRDLITLRFLNKENFDVSQVEIAELLKTLANKGFNIAITCNLFKYNNPIGYRALA